MDDVRTIFSLTTDFGLHDPYVGQLKGALLTGCPWATIVDLTHGIPAWDVATAAITIRTSYRFFPPGTIHLIVVDPGVGSERAILVASGEGHFFVAPDNGCLSLLADDRLIDTIHRVDHPAFFPASISPTFHGRDVIAPVAAALARTGDLGQFGPGVAPDAIRKASIALPLPVSGCLQGQVQHIDRFGNLRTTVRVAPGCFDPASFDFAEVGGQCVRRLARAYHEVEPGGLLALIDSSGYLEIAANQANAADRIGCAPGDPVIVHLVGKTDG